MADTNFLQGLAGVMGMIQGGNIAAAGAEAQAQTIIQGGEIAARGATLTASGFRQSAEAIQRANIFNTNINKINEKRRLAAMSRQFQRTTGSQLAAQSRSGLSLTSKSFLMVQAETANTFEKAMLDFKIDAENARRAQGFQAAVQRVNLENQARAAEFRAAAERAMAATRAAEARYQGEVAQFKSMQQVSEAVPTLLSQVFSGGSSSGSVSPVSIPKGVIIN
jgi:hypothetical protein